MTHSTSDNHIRRPARPPLPVTIVPGMHVYEVVEIPRGEIVAITQAYCLYRLADSDRLCISNWRELALANVCPADPLLPPEVTENDERNAAATALRELLALVEVRPLTEAQSTARDELIRYLRGDK